LSESARVMKKELARILIALSDMSAEFVALR
jgi:hypothetical protein